MTECFKKIKNANKFLLNIFFLHKLLWVSKREEMRTVEKNDEAVGLDAISISFNALS